MTETNTATDATVLRFADLESHLMLRNGNVLYKVPFRGGWAVLKVYFGSRSAFGYVYKTLVHVCFQNHTSLMPRTRRRVESECLALWRKNGIRVFDTYEDVTVEGVPEGGYTLFEYVSGTLFGEFIADPERSVEQKRAMWRRFLIEWQRRHRLAIDAREPRLVHENGTLEHVLIRDDELVYFDLEMAFRSRRRVKAFVAREILSFLKSLGRNVSSGLWDTLLEETVRNYPERELLEYAYRFGCDNPNPLRRLAHWLAPRFKPPDKRPFTRIEVARRLGGFLSAVDPSSPRT
jgi:hypothetical protein